LHGIAPEEYKCAKEFPFFYANGSAVLILVNFADGNSVNPVFGFIYYFLITVTPFFGRLGFLIAEEFVF
jgi:hypothetical protein